MIGRLRKQAFTYFVTGDISWTLFVGNDDIIKRSIRWIQQDNEQHQTYFQTIYQNDSQQSHKVREFKMQDIATRILAKLWTKSVDLQHVYTCKKTKQNAVNGCPLRCFFLNERKFARRIWVQLTGLNWTQLYREYYKSESNKSCDKLHHH